MGTLHEEEEKSLWWWFSCTLSVAPKRVWRKLMWFSSKLIWVNLGWLAIGVESYCSKSCLHTQLGGPVVVVIPCSKSWNHFLGTECCDHLCFPKHSRVGGPWWAFNMWATGMLQLSEGEGFGFLIVSTHFWHFCSVNALKAMSTFPLVFMGSRGETPEWKGRCGRQRSAICNWSLSPSSVSCLYRDKYICRDLCHTFFIMHVYKYLHAAVVQRSLEILS